MSRRVIALFLSVMMVVNLLSVGIFAAESSAVTISNYTFEDDVREAIIPVRVTNFPDDVGAYQFALDYDTKVFSKVEIISGYEVSFTPTMKIPVNFTTGSVSANGSQIAAFDSSPITITGDPEDNSVIFKIKLTLDENAYNCTTSVGFSTDSKTYISNSKGVDYDVAMNGGIITVTNGNVPTLTNVSLTQGEEAVLPMTNSWSYDVTVDGVNDQTFTAGTYAEDAAGNVELPASWATTDKALTIAGASITVAKDASVGAHTATATYNEVSKSFTFNVDRAASVAASVAADPASVALPKGSESDATVTLSAIDQFRDAMDAAFALSGNYAGVTISGNTVTVTKDAKDNFTEGNSFEVGFSSGEATGSFTITRETPAATSVSVAGGQAAIEIPAVGAAAATSTAFTATVLDQYGSEIAGSVEWTITSGSGVSIDTDGKVSVTNAAAETITDTTGVPFTVTATSGTVSGTATITVKRAASVLSSITVEGGQASIEIPADDTAAPSAAFTASGLDQYRASMTPDVAWTITSGSGVSIENGVVSVTKAAADEISDTTGKSFTVTATSGTVSDTATITVKRADPVVTEVKILDANDNALSGTDIIGIPGSKTYQAFPYDQYGAKMSACTLQISDAAEGITLNAENGEVTVADTTADEATATLTATAGGKTATLTVEARKVTVNWLTGRESITYLDEQTAAFSDWSESGTATAYVGSEAKTLSGTFSIVNGDAVLDKGTQTITLKFTINDSDAGSYQGAEFTKDYSVTVNPRTITPTIADIANQEYSGSAIEPELTITWGDYEPVKDTDYTIAYSNNTNAGTATVTVSPVADSNYTFTETTKKFTIDPLTAELAWSGFESLVYTGSEVNVTATVTNRKGNDTFNITVTGGAETDAGTYTATVTALGNSNYALPTVVTKEYTIDQAPLTVSAVTIDAKEYKGTKDATGTITLTGAIGTDAPTATGTFVWDDAKAGTKGFTVTNIALTDPDGNYKLTGDTTKTGTDTTGITKATVEVPAPTATLTLKSSATASEAGESRDFMLSTLLTYATQTGDMTPGEVVSYAIPSDGYGTAIKSANAAISGGKLTITLAKSEALAKGETDTLKITVSSDNYADQTVELTFTFVDKKEVSEDDITFGDITYDYDGSANYNVKATYSGAVSADNWTYTFEREGNTLTEKPVNAGVYKVTAVYEDDVETEDGLPGSYGKKEVTLTINPRTVELKWSNYERRTYDGNPSNVIAEVRNLVAGDECLVDLGGSGSMTKADSYTAKAQGLTGKDWANYVLPTDDNLTVKPYEIVPKQLTILGVTGVDSKTYDGTPSASGSISILLDGIVNSDDVSAAADVVWTSANAGTTTVKLSNITLQGETKGNYTKPADMVTTVYTDDQCTEEQAIGKATLTLTANNKTIAYGDAAVNDGVSSVGFKNGEDESALSGTLKYDYLKDDTAYAVGSDVGTYSIVPSGLTSDNYEIDFESGVLTVEPKKISEVTWGSTELTYNGEEQAPAVTAITGILTADKDAVTAVVSGAQKNASTYTATVGSLSGDKGTNYAIDGVVSTSFSIAPKEVTIENVAAKYENGAVKLYGGTIKGLVGNDDVTIVLPTDPSDFQVAESVGKDIQVDYTATLDGSDKDNYKLKENGWNDVTVDIPLPDVEVAATAVVDEDGNALTGAAVGATGDGYNGVADAASEIAADDTVITDTVKEEAAAAVTNAGGKADNTVVVVVPSVEMSISKDDETGVTTATVTASAVLYATEQSNFENGALKDEDKATEVGTQKVLEVTMPVVIKIPFASSKTQAFVKQIVGGKTLEFIAEVLDDQAIFTATSGLGTFTISETSDAKFKIGDTVYETLQDAVNNVQDGETITVMQDGLTDTAKINKEVSFTLDTGATDFDATDAITAGSGIEVKQEGNKFTATKKASNNNNGGGGSSTPDTVSTAKSENGSVTLSNAKAKAGEKVTVTPKAADGYKVASITVKDDKGNVIPTAKNADGTYSFTMPASGKVTVTPTFEKEGEKKFVDVPENSYYADAVAWAVAQGVTTGTSDTTFSPDAACTRAEAVTFLYRAAGSPEVAANTSFKDVPADSYYAKAVAWAVANGITNGTGDGSTFSPNEICNRAQIVTFLYRFEKGTPSVNTFTDVPTDVYYASAVGWAVNNGVTKGTGDGTTFSPNEPCTRAQIVTFLYRDLAK